MTELNASMKTIDLKGNFDRVYLLYFSRMFRFAKEYVIQDEDAENIVQDVFLMLWEKKDQIRIDTNLAGYLFTLTKYKSLDFLRHKVIQEEFVSEYVLKLQALEQMNYSFSTDAELQLIIDRAIGKLPDKCKDIFIKSRIERKKIPGNSGRTSDFSQNSRKSNGYSIKEAKGRIKRISSSVTLSYFLILLKYM